MGLAKVIFQCSKCEEEEKHEYGDLAGLIKDVSAFPPYYLSGWFIYKNTGRDQLICPNHRTFDVFSAIEDLKEGLK